MIIKGGFDSKDRKLAMKFLPNLTWQGYIDIGRIARICEVGYKLGLFDPFFNDLNSSAEYEKTPFWGIKSITKQGAIFWDTHVYSVEMTRPEINSDLEDIIETGQF